MRRLPALGQTYGAKIMVAKAREKFGTLQLDPITSTKDETAELLQAITAIEVNTETRSETTCELCGCPGTLRD